MIHKLNVDIDTVRNQHLPINYVRFHFTSKRKRMSTILECVEETEHDNDKRIHIKGAAEIILASCDYYINEEGKKMRITNELMQ